MAEPKPGDTIYVPTSLYIGHGEDDVIGGKATVTRVREGISAGRPCLDVSVAEHPGCEYNWDFLAPEQDALARRYGEGRARPEPDPDFSRGGDR